MAMRFLLSYYFYNLTSFNFVPDQQDIPRVIDTYLSNLRWIFRKSRCILTFSGLNFPLVILALNSCTGFTPNLIDWPLSNIFSVFNFSFWSFCSKVGNSFWKSREVNIRLLSCIIELRMAVSTRNHFLSGRISSTVTQKLDEQFQLFSKHFALLPCKMKRWLRHWLHLQATQSTPLIDCLACPCSEFLPV